MSSIEWTDTTWNPVIGCTPVSPGCLNCYAATMAHRLQHVKTAADYAPRCVPDDRRIIDIQRQEGRGYVDASRVKDRGRIVRIAEVKNGRAVFTGEVRCLPHKLDAPLRWRTPRRVFVNSMSDLFHESVPFEFIDRVFAVMALCPRHTFQVLTKRPERMAEYTRRLGKHHERDPVSLAAKDIHARTGRGQSGFAWTILGGGGFLKNVWLGTSVEDQARADERIPHLLECPAAVRFLSCEPLLGPVDLSAFCGGRYVGLPGDVVHPNYNFGLGWVIVGGESGPHARPCDVAWVRSIVRQCADAGVPCFVKQLGRHVQCRNDEVADWLDECGLGLDWIDTDRVGFQGDPVRVMLNDPKGGDPAEWPSDLRVRQWPEVAP